MANSEINILLIEPDEETREIFIKYIHSYIPGISIHAAQDKYDARRLLHEKEIHVIVCDVAMRDKERIFFITELCNERPRIPIVIVTPDTNLRVDNVQTGVRSFCVVNVIHKPLDLATFLDAIKALINKEKIHRTSISSDMKG